MENNSRGFFFLHCTNLFSRFKYSQFNILDLNFECFNENLFVYFKSVYIKVILKMRLRTEEWGPQLSTENQEKVLDLISQSSKDTVLQRRNFTEQLRNIKVKWNFLLKHF